MNGLPAGPLKDLQLTGSARGGDFMDSGFPNLSKQPLPDSHGEIEVFFLHPEGPYQTAATVG